MTRFYGIDEANEALPDVERILLDLRDQRAELIRLRDAVVEASDPEREAERKAKPNEPGKSDEPGEPNEPGESGEREAPVGDAPMTPATETRLMRLRMQGLIDQMQAGVTRLVDRDVMLREIETGLIDFPALASGRQIWLCWRLGEGDIEWWHEHDDGFAGRRRLTDLT
jgi:hypothetical protein